MSLTVIELITQLEQFPPEYIVRFEDRYDSEDYKDIIYGTTIEEACLYPNETCGCVQLKGYNYVLKETNSKLGRITSNTNLLGLQKFILEFIHKK